MIIGITGKARAGKDTTASLFCIIAEKEYGRKYSRYSFAEPIKKSCNELFGWNSDHSDGHLKEVVDSFWGFSPRYAYQTMGTEWGRNLLGEDIWLKAAKYRAQTNAHLIIPDVRFNNEAEFIIKNGALIHVTRPGADGSVGVQGHASEAGIATELLAQALHVNNSGSIVDLTNDIRQLAKYVFTGVDAL